VRAGCHDADGPRDSSACIERRMRFVVAWQLPPLLEVGDQA
jgi:hypothetical protein